MSLISITTPLPLTDPQKRAVTVSKIRGTSKELWKLMLAAYQDGVTQVWQNPQGLTPQQVCDAFGADAAALFNLAGVLKDAINAAVPGTLDPQIPPFTINNDGTVTIGA